MLMAVYNSGTFIPIYTAHQIIISYFLKVLLSVICVVTSSSLRAHMAHQTDSAVPDNRVVINNKKPHKVVGL